MLWIWLSKSCWRGMRLKSVILKLNDPLAVSPHVRLVARLGQVEGGGYAKGKGGTDRIF
jgi:hypothetical protein